jgi:hypothetical protein
VRRFIGKTDSDFKKKIVPLEHRSRKQAVYLDDNSYAKQLWSHVFQGRKFSNRGPNGYELAHLFHHKDFSDTDAHLELLGLEKLSGPVSGFFTSIAGSVFIPTSLARVTDLNLQARKLIQSYAVHLYRDVCNPLPPGVSLNATTTDWNFREFRWAKPVGITENLDKNLELFANFRREEFEWLAGTERKSAA